MCVREKEREKYGDRDWSFFLFRVPAHIYYIARDRIREKEWKRERECVWERKKEREREREFEKVREKDINGDIDSQRDRDTDTSSSVQHYLYNYLYPRYDKDNVYVWFIIC